VTPPLGVTPEVGAGEVRAGLRRLACLHLDQQLRVPIQQVQKDAYGVGRGDLALLVLMERDRPATDDPARRTLR
jgi:hypothetical protein